MTLCNGGQYGRKQPIHELRLGHIRAAIWPNESEGRVWYSVTIARRYRQGDQFKDATSFNRDDLPVVAQISNMAFAWIWERLAQGPDSAEELIP